MNRRLFLRNSSMALSAGSVVPAVLSCGIINDEDKSESSIPVPTAAQKNWQECEVGIIFHFDLPIAARRFADNNTVKQVLDPRLYNPADLDTEQWLSAAKAAGARYAVFTATHFNGFMQWQSDLYPYGLRQTDWRSGKGDVVADFIASCHRADIAPGIYFSTHRNVYWQVWGHYVGWGEGRGTAGQDRFNRIAEKMTAELCSRYGALLQIWFDAGVKTPEEGGPDVLPVFEKYQPDSVFYHNRARSDYRWIGNEEGHADYPCWSTMPGDDISHNAPAWKPLLHTGDPDGTVWSPGMVDIPLRGANGIHNWFWHPDQEHGVYETDDLLRIYRQSVGRNCNLVIGAVITPEGLVPEHDVRRLTEFGNAIKGQFTTPVATMNGGSGNVHEITLEVSSRISAAVIQEDITFGERIRTYKLEGCTNNGKWFILTEGKSIGHKRIERFPAQQLTGVRLEITNARATPKLKDFAVFNTL